LPYWSVIFCAADLRLNSPIAANLPDDSIFPISSVAQTGVYYGYAQVLPLEGGGDILSRDDILVKPMVMSLGWNPFYKNERLSAVCPKKLPSTPANVLREKEIHIMHEFQSDFYGHEMKAIVLGYIRPELDYTSRGDYLF
jgi:riboflavin kinase